MKKKLLVAALGAAFLAGCGGGSSSSADDANPADNSQTITLASKETVKAAGLATIQTASADEVAYDVAADIGDTWRIILDTKKNTFKIQVLSTQFGLTDRTGTFTVSTAGNITTYTGTDFTFSVDNRTQLASGNMTVGNKKATVSGSGYVAGDLSKLAGTYLFVSGSRNASNGAWPEVLSGGFNVKTDGTIDVCVNGEFKNGSCTQIAGFDAPESRSLKMEKDAATGVIKVGVMATAGYVPFGVLHVHAGDRGPALIFDHFGPGDEGVMRVGTFYAAKPSKLTTQLDGSYACAQQGGGTGTMKVAGAKATITNLTTKKTHDEDVTLNQIGNGKTLAALDGVATFKVPGEGVFDAVNILPLSSSMFVEAAHDTSYLTVCVRQ